MRHGPTGGWMDRPTDGGIPGEPRVGFHSVLDHFRSSRAYFRCSERMCYGPTDGPSYRDARTHLKMCPQSSIHSLFPLNGSICLLSFSVLFIPDHHAFQNPNGLFLFFNYPQDGANPSWVLSSFHFISLFTTRWR